MRLATHFFVFPVRILSAPAVTPIKLRISMVYDDEARALESGNQLPSSDDERSNVVRERISTAIERIGGLKSAGKAAGVTDEQVARWRDGKSKPSFFGMIELCRAAGMSLDWVAGLVQQSQQLQSQTLMPADLTMIPRYDVRASSGAGNVVPAEDVFEHLAFKTAWLRSMGIAPANAALVTNEGDSNEPTIPDGALMLLDLGIDKVANGFFYALLRDGELLVKRVQQRMDGSVLLIPDNPRYEREEIPADRVHALHVVGRVKWVARSI